ncbi:tetratricopeptide repeat protein [Actinokineospora diospyrosa]|uniref:TIR domain-containing protein n=1 Tax=Actinokineospora diospyrosa TaxID=103728 RepID=A0ABT1I9P6_9PSEU|nr:toll/interleukin-1 receptor domain-containing protein [Actinokineospora diospyrosa]MCP2269317.1 TIR domain-containing protein [Actinokineospora diospyrosa]
MDCRHDVFLSYSGADRERVLLLHRALRVAGLEVFLDKRDIRRAHSITTEIMDGLRTSKTLLAYFSNSFAHRSACQFELHHTYLSALRANEVERRILVINPEDPATGHLKPLHVRAHRYWNTWTSDRELAELVAQVKAAVGLVSTPFPGLDFTEPVTPRESTPTVSTANFVGRYDDRWRLHSALHRGEEPLVERASGPPVAAVSGMTGMGKSALVRSYGRDFGFLYPGGVYWVSLAGAGVDEVRYRHTSELVALDSSIVDQSRSGVLAWWRERLVEPALWVVDDVPGDLDEDLLAELVLPGPRVHTVLIGRHEFPQGFAEQVRVLGLDAEEGQALFAAYQPYAEEETAAVAELVARLGGHPYAILLAAQGARGREGLWELRDRVGELTSDAAVLDVALHAVRQAIVGIEGPRRVVLALAVICASTPLPARLIDEVLAVLAPGVSTHALLAEMNKAHLVERAGAAWQVHHLVRTAARHDTDPGAMLSTAAVAAHKLLQLAEDDVPGLIEHAVALLDHIRGSAYAEPLNVLAVNHYESHGAPAMAAPLHENLAELHSQDPRHLLRAAQARRAAGQLDEASAHVDRLDAMELDPQTRLLVESVRAQVLDDLGSHGAAETCWRAILAGELHTLSVAEQVQIRTARIHNVRMLGHLRQARDLARDLVALPAPFELLVPAHLELAWLEADIGDRAAARDIARRVVDFYRERAMPEHQNAIDAAILLHAAQLKIFILQSIPDRDTQVAAEVELRDQLAAARHQYGPENPRTLALAVTHMEVLIALGESTVLLERYTSLPARLARRLGATHRLYLRSLFLIGQAHNQLGDRSAAGPHFTGAYGRQLATLGPNHPFTLETSYELGMLEWHGGNAPRAREIFRTVMAGADREIGRANDIYGKAFFAIPLTFAPSGLLRFF